MAGHLDHTGIGVSDMGRAARFYDAALGALGLRRVMEMPAADGLAGVGYGTDYPVFWIDLFHPAGQRNHTAFAAPDRAAVDAFHAAGLAAGGTDNGAPGPRPVPDALPIRPRGYYAAFLLDPDGNNIEAVFRHAPDAAAHPPQGDPRD